MTHDRCIKALGLWRVAVRASFADPDLDFVRGLQPAPEDAQLGWAGQLGTPGGTWVDNPATRYFLPQPRASTGLSFLLSDCDLDCETACLHRGGADCAVVVSGAPSLTLSHFHFLNNCGRSSGFYHNFL